MPVEQHDVASSDCSKPAQVVGGLSQASAAVLKNFQKPSEQRQFDIDRDALGSPEEPSHRVR
ncbi:hypothetical protein EDD22DRAFT_959053 [Suillus occidentalis]|nr:hypothetical protein EDD22DRAFT_959053 [Suillus occidentalis]